MWLELALFRFKERLKKAFFFLFVFKFKKGNLEMSADVDVFSREKTNKPKKNHPFVFLVDSTVFLPLLSVPATVISYQYKEIASPFISFF